MKYEELENEEKVNESIVYSPNITYVTKNKHKVLKNTIFYLAVAVLLVFNILFIVDLSSTEFTSTITQGLSDFFNGSESGSQTVVENSNYVQIGIAEKI